MVATVNVNVDFVHPRGRCDKITILAHFPTAQNPAVASITGGTTADIGGAIGRRVTCIGVVNHSGAPRMYRKRAAAQRHANSRSMRTVPAVVPTGQNPQSLLDLPVGSIEMSAYLELSGWTDIRRGSYRPPPGLPLPLSRRHAA